MKWPGLSVQRLLDAGYHVDGRRIITSCSECMSVVRKRTVPVRIGSDFGLTPSNTILTHNIFHLSSTPPGAAQRRAPLSQHEDCSPRSNRPYNLFGRDRCVSPLRLEGSISKCKNSVFRGFAETIGHHVHGPLPHCREEPPSFAPTSRHVLNTECVIMRTKHVKIL